MTVTGKVRKVEMRERSTRELGLGDAAKVETAWSSTRPLGRHSSGTGASITTSCEGGWSRNTSGMLSDEDQPGDAEEIIVGDHRGVFHATIPLSCRKTPA